MTRSGLPDICLNQKSQFGLILECLAMTDVGYFMAIWYIILPFSYILWPFGKFRGHFGIFSSFGMLYLGKSVNP
jgi:hypothetical protein